MRKKAIGEKVDGYCTGSYKEKDGKIFYDEMGFKGSYFLCGL